MNESKKVMIRMPEETHKRLKVFAATNMITLGKAVADLLDYATEVEAKRKEPDLVSNG